MSQNSSPPVGVIGLGIMGLAIARNLMKGGFDVVGFDIDSTRTSALSSAGGTAARSVTAVAEACGVILSSLPSDAALAEVVGELGRVRRKAIVVELSTLALDLKSAARERLATSEMTLLDCPISGTGAQAVNRDLVVFASGDESAMKQCAPVFAAFAKAHPYVGPFGNGMKLKLIANLLVAIHNVSTAEAVALGRRAGLDLDVLLKVIGPGAGGSRMLDIRGPMMVRGDYEPATMKLDVWQKDMDLIANFAAALGANTPLFDATKSLYAEATAEGGTRDAAAVHDVLARGRS